MYIKDGIVYAGDTRHVLGVVSVRPMEGYSLMVRFTDGSQRTVDLVSLLDSPAFSPLKDKDVFNQVYVEYGVPTWCDGKIDLAPEWMFEHGL